MTSRHTALRLAIRRARAAAVAERHRYEQARTEYGRALHAVRVIERDERVARLEAMAGGRRKVAA